MKKLIYAFTIGLVVASCSVEENEGLDTTLNLSQHAVFDNSNLGIYKGIFSTLDSRVRGTVEINLSKNSYATATVLLNNGEYRTLMSNEEVTDAAVISKMTFNTATLDGLSFDFSVAENGSNPLINNVFLEGSEGAIKVLKETSRAPVVPISGTYSIDGGSGGDTFSLAFSGDGSGDDTGLITMIMRGGVDYGTMMGNSQTGCTVAGDFTECAISGTSATLPGGNTITWMGAHTYGSGVGAPDCSGVMGTWTSTGGASGSFESDDSCVVTLVYEDFEDDIVFYVPNVPEFISGSGLDDYFVRTDGSDITSSAVYTGVVGTHFFGAQDIDGGGVDAEQWLTFDGIPVDGLTTIDFSALFAEDDDGTSEDWDASDFLIVEFSFDGVAYTEIFAIENDGSTFNSAPFVDTDFDGVGDGAEITDTFTSYGASFPNDATTNPGGSPVLEVRIRMSLNSGDEDIAIDEVLIEGN